jgi:riboflavin synthase
VFTIHLIPETLRITNLSDRVVGDSLNIEIDHQTQVIVETVERYMKTRGGLVSPQ